MTLRVASAVVALAVTSAAAQQPANLPPPRQIEVVNLRDAQVVDVPEPPEPPPGANSWSLRIHTSGGFTGQGVGSVTISSDGQVGCGAAPCATPGGTTLLERFEKAIVSAVAGPWGTGPSSICSDCIRTTIVLKRRDGDVVRVYRASWDDSQPPSAELRELRRLALELRSARSGR